ncbi:MAG: threonine--tRNA ligase [Candidatus Omnitrophica bacterium]|nr:threonine--tRNA ligase [Candidatus Omnitrophota bacterium]
MSEIFVTNELDKLRHSASHIMAEAVKKLYPAAKLAIGPAIKDGFYYDIDFPEPVGEDVLPRIEEAMRGIVERRSKFKQLFMKREEAVKFFEKKREPYKVEIIKGIADAEVSLFDQGEFVDLCRGPHVEHTGLVKAFKLLNTAGAYWRGKETNPMLTRIYGTAFAAEKDLKEYLDRLELARKRDHRILGKQLDLFSFHVEAPGMPFYHAKGQTILQIILDHWRAVHRQAGYIEVKTPMVLSDELWRKSGHYDHYKENMFFTESDKRPLAIKPMNCPGGTLIYKSAKRSYRDLPIRMAELGLVHRNEVSGALHGLFRAKAFTIDDAHVFCTEEQIGDEVAAVIRLIREMYKVYGFESIQVHLSTRPTESMGSDAIWEKATSGLKQALQNNKLDYTIAEGGGAFYGPKIDFEVEDSLGRTWQCGTIQLDFQMPERLDLAYTGTDGTDHRPVMVHRAIFGSVERFFGILIEHFGGAFPVWLSPVQVVVASISEKQEEVASKVCEQLFAAGVRAELDIRAAKISYKIREAEAGKVPYIAVVGDREAESKQVALRGRGRRDLGSFKIDDLISKIGKEVEVKAL